MQQVLHRGFAVIAVAGVTAVLASVSVGAQTVHAQGNYPYRPIRIVQGFSPGGVSDTLARIVGDKLGQRLGQSVIVEAKPGGGGIVGMTTVIEATHDGYTLLLGNSTITVSPNRKDKPRFNPMTEFVPVSMFGTSPSILLANPSMPANSVTSLIAYAKKMPGEINCATSGIGSTNDLAVHLFNHMAGVKIVNIPYKGSGPSLSAVLGNETALSFAPLLPSIPHIQFKRLKAIGVSSLRRNSAVPDVPAIAESLPGFDAVGFFGIVAARQVPKSIVEKLHREINTILGMPEVQTNFARLGLDLNIMTVDQFASFIAADAKKWADLVQKAHLVF